MKKFLSLLLVIAMIASMAVSVGALSNTSISNAAGHTLGSTISFYSSEIETTNSSVNGSLYYHFRAPYKGKINVSFSAYCTKTDSGNYSGFDLNIYIYNSSQALIAKQSLDIPGGATVGRTYYGKDINIELDAGYYYIRIEKSGTFGYWTRVVGEINVTTSFQCSHKNTSTKTTVEPTCSEYGTSVMTCHNCNKTVRTDNIAKLPHTPADEWVKISDPTCAKAGEEQKACTVCGGVAEKQSIDKLPHTYGDWTTDTEPTCAKAGKRSRVCSACGNKETESIDMLDHEYGEWEITTEPTCTVKGKETRKCENCGKSESNSLDMLEHSFGDWEVVTKATCTSKGKQTRECSTCGKDETETVDMLEHDYGKWEEYTRATCDSTGTDRRYCKLCNKYESRTTDKLEHVFDKWEVYDEPSCTETGVERRYCDLCNKYETRTLEKTAHEYEDYQIVHQPTCTQKGEERGYCDQCGKSVTEDIPMLDHNYGEWEVTMQPTCAKAGKQTATCRDCGKTSTKTVAKLDHSFSEWEVTTAPTCTKEGKQTHKCTSCSRVETETVEKVPHTVDEWTVTKEATETRKGTRKGKCTVCGKNISENYEKYPGRDGFKKSRSYGSKFSDVGKDKWFNQYVETAYEYGLVNGTTDTKFSPDSKFTVAQALTAAANIHCAYYDGEVGKAKSGEPWYTPYVNYCIENGIIEDGQFDDYTKNIKRGEMAEIFANILPDNEYDGVRNGVPSDMKSTMKAYKSVEKLYKAGIVSGDAKTGNYRPDDEIVRSEACVIFTRIAVESYRAK